MAAIILIQVSNAHWGKGVICIHDHNPIENVGEYQRNTAARASRSSFRHDDEQDSTETQARLVEFKSMSVTKRYYKVERDDVVV